MDISNVTLTSIKNIYIFSFYVYFHVRTAERIGMTFKTGVDYGLK